MGSIMCLLLSTNSGKLGVGMSKTHWEIVFVGFICTRPQVIGRENVKWGIVVMPLRLKPVCAQLML